MAEQGKPETGLVQASRIQQLIESDAVKRRFEQAVGRRAGAFISSIIAAYNSNPALKECEPMSVISAGAIAATLDLPINPSLGFAHIVPYKGVGQFQIGWKGYVQLAQRTGHYRTMHATVVKEGQIKDVDWTTGDIMFNKEATSEKVIGYLFFFRLINGFEKHYYMSRDQMEAHAKRYSASYKNGKGQWVDNFDVMGLKTVTKLGLAKWGILSVELQKAFETDQAAIDEEGKPTYIDVDTTTADPTQPPTDPERPGRLAAAVEAQTTAPQPPQENLPL